MNEVLKRRLTGAAVLLGAAFLLTWLLPEPQSGGAGGEGGVVTIDLNAPPPPLALPVPATPVPEVIAAAETTQIEPPTQAETQSSPATTPESEVPTALAMTPASVAPAPIAPDADKPAGKPAMTLLPALKMEPKLAAKPAPAKPPASGQVRAKPSPLPTPKPAWYVQTGSYSDLDKARQDEERYKAAGYKVLISPADTRKGTFYRVRLGPYPSKDSAELARARVSTQGNAQATVLED